MSDPRPDAPPGAASFEADPGAQDPRADWASADFDPFGPDGYARPRQRGAIPDLTPLLVLLDTLRAALPRELQQQANSLLREVLLTLRALIDWYLERLDGGRRETPVEDIPIE